MKKLFVFLLASVYVCAPAFAQKIGHAKFIADTKRVTSDVFKDPDAVRFRDIGVYQKYNSEERYLCGEVNAKNSYGAYVGYKSFYATPTGASVITDEESRIDWIYYRENCHKKLAAAK